MEFTAAGIDQESAFLSVDLHNLGHAAALATAGTVVGHAAALASAGAAFGVLGAWALSNLLTSQLFGVSATDPTVFATVTILVVLVTLVASVGPARRAMRVDPIAALRVE